MHGRQALRFVPEEFCRIHLTLRRSTWCAAPATCGGPTSRRRRRGFTAFARSKSSSLNLWAGHFIEHLNYIRASERRPGWLPPRGLLERFSAESHSPMVSPPPSRPSRTPQRSRVRLPLNYFGSHSLSLNEILERRCFCVPRSTYLSWSGFGLFEKKATVSDVLRLRRIWTSPPVCMGRRSCKIAGRKVRAFPPFPPSSWVVVLIIE